jgi:phosphoribosylformylglycinamidine synthase
VPIVSGNVSLYNETDRRAILPTPTVAAVGLVRDERAIVTAWFKQADRDVLLLGATGAEGLGGSEYVVRHSGRVAGPAPRINLELEVRLQRLLVELAEAELLESAHDVSDGGLAVALAECCSVADDELAMIGARIRLSETGANALFGEAPTRVVLSAPPANSAEITRRADAAGVPCERLGSTGGDRLVLEGPSGSILNVPLSAIRRARETCLEPIVGP